VLIALSFSESIEATDATDQHDFVEAVVSTTLAESSTSEGVSEPRCGNLEAVLPGQEYNR
jgi:hypothetical protein